MLLKCFWRLYYTGSFLAFLSLIIASPSHSVAQTVEYETVEDDAVYADLYLQPFSFHLTSITASGNLVTMGWDIQADYFSRYRFALNFNRTIYPFFDFKNFQWKNMTFANSNKPHSTQYSYTEIGGTFLFSSKNKVKNVKIELDRQSAGNDMTRVTTIKVPVTHRQLVGLRGGVTIHREPLVLWKKDGITTEDGLVLPQDVLTKIDANSVYSGISFSRSHDATIDVKGGYGKRSSEQFKHYHFDVMFAPVISVRDPVVNGVTYELKGAVDEEGDKVYHTNEFSHFGWRFGYQKMGGRGINMGYKFEIGKTTGVKKNYFLRTSFSLALNLLIDKGFRKKE